MYVYTYMYMPPLHSKQFFSGWSLSLSGTNWTGPPPCSSGSSIVTTWNPVRNRRMKNRGMRTWTTREMRLVPPRMRVRTH